MVEAKLRVKVTHYSTAVNKAYDDGITINKKVIEESFCHDMDKREDVAPYGVIATFSIDKSYTDTEGKHIDAKEIFDIKVNRRYLEYESGGSYIAFFHIDKRVFELFVHFEGAHITNITLNEWLNCGYFEDGDDADNVYEAKSGLVVCDILED